MKKINNIVFRILILIFALLLVFISPFMTGLVGDDLSLIYSTFIGKKSDYQGIIEVWNVDSFESGTAPKVKFLENIAQKFQRENKGVYIVIRNLTQNECLNLLSSGEKPDIFSCSYGVSKKIKEYVMPYDSEPTEKFSETFLSAGRIGQELYGLAWTVGYYFLISTKAKLEKAGVNTENIKLNEIAYDVGYEYKSGKTVKQSVSLAYGSGLYLMPKNSLIAYNRARSIQLNESKENELNLKTGYSAYCSFLSNESTILLGTHRDVWRMMAREEKGNVNDVIYLPLINWTDLVQFAFITKKGGETQNVYAEKFALSLTSSENQKQLESIGMFSILSGLDMQYKGVMCDIIPDNFSDLELNPVI